jgi:hypothetical protein
MYGLRRQVVNHVPGAAEATVTITGADGRSFELQHTDGSRSSARPAQRHQYLDELTAHVRVRRTSSVLAGQQPSPATALAPNDAVPAARAELLKPQPSRPGAGTSPSGGRMLAGVHRVSVR